MASSGKKSKVKTIVIDRNSHSSISKGNGQEDLYQLWKTKSKKLQHYGFIDKILFSEYLANNEEQPANKTSKKQSQKNNEPQYMKYIDIIKFIDKNSTKAELECLCHNLAIVYDMEPKKLLEEASKINIPAPRMPKDTSLDQFLKGLIEKRTGSASENHSSSSSKSKEKKDSKSSKEIKVEKEKKEELRKPSKSVEKSPEAERRLTRHQQDKKIEKETKETKETKIEQKEKEKRGKSSEKSTEKIREESKAAPKISKQKTRSTSNERENLEELESNSKVHKKMKTEKKEVSIKPEKKKDGNRKKKLEIFSSESDVSESEEDAIAAKTPEKVASKATEKVAATDYVELQINNDIDNEEDDGFSFFYLTDNVYNKTEQWFQKAKKDEDMCNCLEGCIDPAVCPCARYNFDNSGKTQCYIYDKQNDRKKLVPFFAKKDLHIYECTPNCKCNKMLCLNSCINEKDKNKVDINDLIIEKYEKKYHGDDPKLKSVKAKMWGVRTKVPIPAYTYVSEYCGEIITKKEGDRRGEKYDSINCNYLFDLNKHVEVEKIDPANNLIFINVDGICETRNIKKLKEISEFFPLCIDAFFYGNHSRFVNHSCDPNMVAQPVHVENRNIFLPKIIFFAKRDIEAGEELTINYNCAPLKSLDHIEKLVCLCGAKTCKGFVYDEGYESEDAENIKRESS